MGYPVGYSPYEYSVFPDATNRAAQVPAGGFVFPPGVMPVTVNSMSGPPAAVQPKEKPGFWSKLGSAVKGFVKGATVGLVKTVVDIVTDPRKLAMAAVAVGACFIPGVGPVIAAGLMTYGVLSAGVGMAKGTAVAAEGWKSGDTEIIEKGFSDVGTSTAVGALSVAGMRGAVAAKGATPKGTGFMQMNKSAWTDGKAFVGQVKTNGIGAEFTAARTGLVQNLKTNVVEPFKSARGQATQVVDDIAAQTADDVANAVRSADDIANVAQVADDAAATTTTAATGGLRGWAQDKWQSLRSRNGSQAADDAANPTTTTAVQSADDVAGTVGKAPEEQLALFDEAGNINPAAMPAPKVQPAAAPKVQLSPAEATRLKQLQNMGEQGRLPWHNTELANLLAKQNGTVVAPTTSATTTTTASINPFRFKRPDVRQGTADFFNGIHNVTGSINKAHPGLLLTVPAFSGPYSEVDQLIAEQQALYAQHGGHA